jgi:hypothetical protein
MFRRMTGYMREPVAETPSNWVQVTKKDGRLLPAAGKETLLFN